MDDKRNYRGMTVNERLFAGGLLAEWDAAVKSQNREHMLELLSRVDLGDGAESIVNAVLANPERYGF